MNVIFVSNCHDKAARRTQRILDSYATRIAPRTWASPVTEQGLGEIRRGLAATASRRTAVACYRARGKHDLRLVWVVGSRKRFGAQGQFAIGVRTSKLKTPTWIRIGTLIVNIAGLTHDWGKGTQLFQDKLATAQMVVDAVRHEWMSAWMLEPFLFNIKGPLQETASWESCAKRAASPNYLPRPLKDGIVAFEDVISFLVVSHHRLTGKRGGQGACDAKGHVDGERANYRYLMPFKESLSALGPSIRKAQKLYKRLKGKSAGKSWSQSLDVSMGMAWLGRAALILADHSVSAVRDRKLFGLVESNQPAATCTRRI